MKIEEIKKICGDFVAAKNLLTGKIRCQYFDSDKKICALANRVSCKYLDHLKSLKDGTAKPKVSEAPEVETKQPAKKTDETKRDALPPFMSVFDDEEKVEVKKAEEKTPHAGLIEVPKQWTYSYSQMSLFISCPYKYFLKYVANIKPEFTPIYFIVGRAYHQAIENIKRTGEKTIIFDSTENTYEDAKINAVMEVIWEKFVTKDEVEVEKKHYFNHGAFKFVAILDEYNLVTKDIADNKTSSDIESYSLLDIIYQLSIYKQVKPEAEGYVVNLIQKPKNRPKKSESARDFYERIKTEVLKKPDKFFKRLKFYATEVDSDRYMKEAMYIFEEIELCKKSGIWVRNPRNCGMFQCEYGKTCITKLQGK